MKQSPRPVPSMAPAPSKLYSDDVSLLVVALDTNPFFWAGAATNPSSTSLSFSKFLNHVLPFLNAILLLHQLNQVVVIATGVNSCDYIYDSSAPPPPASGKGNMPGICSEVLQKLEDFLIRDRRAGKDDSAAVNASSLLSGSLSLALCYVQRVFRSGPLHPQPRLVFARLEGVLTFFLLCVPHFEKTLTWLTNPLYSFPMRLDSWLINGGNRTGMDGRVSTVKDLQMDQNSILVHTLKGYFGRYVAVMNSIFSAQRSMVPIDSCVVGVQHSAFLQQVIILDFLPLEASYITGGVYLKPQHLDGLFQYLSMVFATDLHSRSFLQLPKPVGVDFRAS
ncbi:hypothetical protein ACLOJK_013811 [Asimina triloba]